MATLDHLIVPARDRHAAAQRLAGILGVPWDAESAIGPFSAVHVNDGLTLDIDQCAGPLPVLHFCFRLDEAEMDALLARLTSLGVAWRSTPHGPADHQVNRFQGGRIVYWSEPDGHVWEALTRSYARRRSPGQDAMPPLDTRSPT